MQDKKIEMAELYANTHKRIYDFLYKYCNNPDLAMDLMQDTFLNYFKSYGEQDLDQEKSIMILYTIARNRSINFGKKFSTQREKSAPVDDFKSERIGFEKKLELLDLENKLLNCLDELAEDEKECILLRHIEGLNLTQISGIMNISVSTASRLVVKSTANLLELAQKNNITLE
ncbi:RNA polymerase sigma factor [Leptospira sp. GIMC2001]|uniref:RNA polymerase sigma factor n=1 Tax=Leptospira sp. GIMC2001 TaxID=1513297 RepID=UPI002349C422|nr:sigma-70 family RNA polymerase sigma factor [Leptospira sp. GIMC2001]WCL47823.1 sigma-70 family RNA polymerase sigma factor [Leptospira sp. GIMC2001]